MLLVVFHNEEEEGVEEDGGKDQRLVKVMVESTLVSARMVALVKANEIVKVNVLRKQILTCLVLVKMVRNGLDLNHVKIMME